MNLKICYLKIDVSCEASVTFQHMSQNATPATEFAPCHHFAQPWQWESQKKHATRHVWSAAPATQNDDGVLQSAAPATKNETHLLKTTHKYCACHTKNDFRHIMRHVGMSQSATRARWNEATRHLKPPKVTTLAELAIGTAILLSRRSLANGCRRLRAPKQRQANMSPLPDPQSKTRTLCYAFGKKDILKEMAIFMIAIQQSTTTSAVTSTTTWPNCIKTWPYMTMIVKGLKAA